MTVEVELTSRMTTFRKTSPGNFFQSATGLSMKVKVLYPDENGSPSDGELMLMLHPGRTGPAVTHPPKDDRVVFEFPTARLCPSMSRLQLNVECKPGDFVLLGDGRRCLFALAPQTYSKAGVFVDLADGKVLVTGTDNWGVINAWALVVDDIVAGKAATPIFAWPCLEHRQQP